MNTLPKFELRQEVTATVGDRDVPCRVFGREPGDGARGFHDEKWVYHVFPRGCVFGVNVGESAIQLPTS